MRTIVCLSRKGGSGKTLLATNLSAGWSIAHPSVTLIDLDPQSSAAIWATRRPHPTPRTITTTPPLLATQVEAAQQRGDRWCVVDTAPHADAAALKAAGSADAVLIPCRPSQADLDVLPATLDLLQLVSVPAAVVINAATPRGQYRDLIAALEEGGSTVCPVLVRQRVAYNDAFAAGLGAIEARDSSAASEMQEFLAWVEQWLS